MTPRRRVLDRRLDGATERGGALFGAHRPRLWWPERLAFGEEQALHCRRDRSSHATRGASRLHNEPDRPGELDLACQASLLGAAGVDSGVIHCGGWGSAQASIMADSPHT